MRISPRLLAAAVLLAGAAVAPRPARAEDDKPNPVDETRGYVGYKPALVQGLSADDRKQLGITRETGLMVAEATPGAPGAVAGLEANDVILKINGVDIDVSKIGRDDKDAFSKWVEGDFRQVTSKIKPGDKVEMVVDRKGKTLTLTPVAVSKAEYESMVKTAEEEERWGPVPDPARAGPANASAYDFETLREGLLRPEELSVVGVWEVVEEDGSKNHVLQQSETIPSADRLLALVTGSGRSYTDGTVSCRFKLLGGMSSVSAGLAFRARSRRDYYAAFVDGVTKTFSIVAVEKGKRRVVASVATPSPKLKNWHEVTVTFTGKKIEATFDKTIKVSGDDGAFTSGWAGLYCEQDAQTDFDDWRAAPK